MQMLWMILGGGKASVCKSFWHCAHRIGRVLLRRRSPSRHACAAEGRIASRLRMVPRIPQDGHCPRPCWHHVWAWAGTGACRLVRPHRQSACWGRRARLLAVLRCIPQTPWRARVQEGGKPRKAPVPGPSADACWARGFLPARSPVCVGGLRRPQRAHRLGSPALLCRASASTAPPMTHASAQRRRPPRPGIRGCPACAPPASRTSCRHRLAQTGAPTPPGGTPVAGWRRTPAALPPACRHCPRHRMLRPAVTRCRRTARRGGPSLRSTSPRTSASPIHPMASVLHRSRRAGSASWGLRPCRTPSAPSAPAGASIASPSLATALWSRVSAHVGVPIGRGPLAALSRPTRAPGGAWERPLRRRSCRSRRGASRCAASAGAVTPSIPGARACLVLRDAARRTSPSRRGARVVKTRWGAWAACAASRCRWGGTVGARTVSPVGLSRGTCCPASPSRPWIPWALVPHLPRDAAPRRRPPAPRRARRVARASLLPCLLPACVVSVAGASPGGRSRATPGLVVGRSPVPAR